MKSRDEWLKPQERRYATCEKWGMRFRSLLAGEVVRYRQYSITFDGKGEMRQSAEKTEELDAYLLVQTAVDDSGKRLFTNADIRPLMAAMDGEMFSELVAFATAHCGIKPKSEIDLDALGKNSGETSSDEQP